MHVAVLSGGVSSEREGSLAMGAKCAEALRAAGYAVTRIDVGHDIAERLRAVAPDVAFNALMGRWGEDGVIQGLLEAMRIPYTHSGVCASAIGMDKARAKAVFAAAGLPVPEGRIVAREELASGHPMRPPYVLKPNAEGSSLGMRVVRGADERVPDPPETAGALLVERFVPGRDLTVTVLRDRAFCASEIETANGVWDFDAKYHRVPSRRITPAALPAEVTARARDLAERAHRAIGARFLSRTDLRWQPERGADGLVVLEINTQPAIGLPGGTIDEQIAHLGIPLPTLCRWLVEDAGLDR